MWGYYGSKANIIDMYPRPKYNKVIESCAGSARYAYKYFDRDVLLVDKYPVIVNIWKWLQLCSVEDIKRLPHFMEPGQALSDFQIDCQEAKDLLGFLIGFGMPRPRKSSSVKRLTVRPNHINFSLKRIERDLYKIKHWKIELGTYEDIPNQEATWFIDPPYQFGGHCYVHSNKQIDFSKLAEWCKTRQGQVIVCENMKANWMDFKPLTNQTTSNGVQKEAIWTNEYTHFDNEQLKMAM